MMATDEIAVAVHLLAIPRHVTLRAERKPNAVGDGHYYAITGNYAQGEDAFHPDHVVVYGSEAGRPAEALRVALGRFRVRGW